jgi:hypothetical protein
VPVDPPPEARDLAVAAAAAVGDLVGVDLLHVDGATWSSSSSAVDFTHEYGDDIFVRGCAHARPAGDRDPVPGTHRAARAAPVETR